MVRKTIRLYTILAVLMHCGIAGVYAVYVSFLLHKGLDILQICLVLSAYYWLLAPLECPTGAIADVYGRRTAVVLSNVFLILSMLVFAFTGDMLGFVGAVALKAIGRTYANGALDSFLADRLDAAHASRLMPAVLKKTEVQKTWWSLGVAFVGSGLADVYMALPWIMSIGIFTGALIVAIGMREVRTHHAKFSFREGGEILVNTVRAGLRHGREPYVLMIVVISAVFWLATMTPNVLWQPYAKQWLPYESALGVVWVGSSLAHLSGIWVATKLKMRGLRSLVLFIAVVGTGIVCTGLFYPSPYLILIVYLVHQAARGPFDPEKKACLYRHVRNQDIRATVASFVSMVQHICAAIGLTLTGLVAHYVSMQKAFFISGLTMVVLSMIILTILGGKSDIAKMDRGGDDRRTGNRLARGFARARANVSG